MLEYMKLFASFHDIVPSKMFNGIMRKVCCVVSMLVCSILIIAGLFRLTPGVTKAGMSLNLKWSRYKKIFLSSALPRFYSD